MIEVPILKLQEIFPLSSLCYSIKTFTWIRSISKIFSGSMSNPNGNPTRNLSHIGFLIFGFYCTSKNLLVKESLLVKVRQQVKKDLVKNVVMYNEAGLIKL